MYHIFYCDNICGDTHFSTYMYNVGLVLKFVFRVFFCFWFSPLCLLCDLVHDVETVFLMP